MWTGKTCCQQQRSEKRLRNSINNCNQCLLDLKSTSHFNGRYFPFHTKQLYAPSCFHLFHQTITKFGTLCTWRGHRSANSADVTTGTVSVVAGFPHGVNEICALLGCYAGQNGSFLWTFPDNSSVPS